MQLEVVTSEDTLSLVISDLSRRRAQIQEISSRGQSKVIEPSDLGNLNAPSSG